ncbi:MAG TPA: peptide-methionine (R)-S-oxide reductase MsrB [Pyrinomonadaceae bacterium]
MNRRYFIKSGATLGAAAVLFRVPLAEALAQRASKGNDRGAAAFKKISKTNEEWKRILTAEQYYVMREKGTEAPGSSPLLKNYAKGTYVCAACALPLFSSKTKYDSRTGWPSFWSPIAKRNVREEQDNADGMTRTEILCNRCDAHLGHVFDDGPDPTGLRYCMNGVALKFVPGTGRV